jgi:hypothetical protein
MKFIYLDEPQRSFKYLDEEERDPVAAQRKAQVNNPSLGQVGKGLVAEVGIGVGGQAAGAALAPFTLGLSYPVLAFGGGVAGSIAAQESEGRDDISVGRALFAGLVNLIPGSSAVKGGAKAATRLPRRLVAVRLREPEKLRQLLR